MELEDIVTDVPSVVDDESSSENYSYSYSSYDLIYIIPVLPDEVKTPLTIVFAISVALASIGNVVVICLMTCARRRKSSMNSLMLNLAMSDWTLGLLCLPFLFAYTMMGEWIFGKALCYIIPFAMKVSQIVSIFTVTVIGLDRYHVVMYPLKRKLSTKGKNIIILFIWLVAFALSSPQLIYAHHSGPFPVEGNRTSCTCGNKWPSSHHIDHKEVYLWMLFILTYAAPLVLLSSCYIQIGLKLWRRTLPGHIDAQRDREQERAKRKAVRTLISLIILFAVCWLPLNFYNLFLITYNKHYLSTSPQATMASRACIYIWLILSDTIFNPIAYVFLSENFKKNLKMFVYRLKRSFGREADLPYTDGSTVTTAVSTTNHRVEALNTIPMKPMRNIPSKYK